MRLPDVRSAMFALALELNAAGMENEAKALQRLAEETRRRSPIRRAASRAPALTPEIIGRIRETARAYPHWSFAEIGTHCNVNQGRVSEVLVGFRT